MKYKQADLARELHISRQAVSMAAKENPPRVIIAADGYIDSEDETNAFYIENIKIKKGILSALEKPIQKSEPKKTKIIKPEIEEPDDIPAELLPYTENDEDGKPKSKVPLGQQKLYLEVEILKGKNEKQKLENRKARADLVEMESLCFTVFNYLSALNKNILEMPLSFVDEFKSAQLAGKSKSDLIDILRKPISASIADTVSDVKKEIDRYKRSVRTDLKNEK